jgi:hypothetical protein
MKRRLAVPLAALLAVVAAPTLAHADSTIKQPGQHPDYHVEIEPHGVLGFAWWGFGPYGSPLGFGGGARFSIPLCKNCFVPKINNNVAISFGADLAFYPFVQAGYPVFTDLYLPVAMQWNFFIHKKWSIAGELGFSPVIGVFYDYNWCGARNCNNWWVYPDAGFVARYHFSDKVSLTMRIGFPEFFNVGVSFFL